MPTESSIEPFLDNWSYLRAELNWLDRVLAVAVARQRREVKEVERVARSKADLATSHWWKGLLNLDGDPSYDSPADGRRKTSPTKANYQQQLDAKIQVSQQRGIALGIPTLCSRLELSVFEKNLLLMALAPEISRRYGRIYNYLQESEQIGAMGLPTVDLILRILCRNDAEWRTARHCLTVDSPLVKSGLIEVQTFHLEPFLARPVKLSDPLVNYLLADQPEAKQLEALLRLPPSSKELLEFEDDSLLELPPLWAPTAHRMPANSADPWQTLVLPPGLRSNLQHLCDRVQLAEQVDQEWGFQAATGGADVGTLVLFVGAPGSGKTTAAHAIAHTLQTSIFAVDLALINSVDYPRLLRDIAIQAPTVLLLQSAQVWFGQHAPLSSAQLQQFWQQRRCERGITLLTTKHLHSMRSSWRQQMDQVLTFPLPDSEHRLILWQQAFPAQLPLESGIDWQWLAEQFPVTGGVIQAIAREAALYAAAEPPGTKVSMRHLQQALAQRSLKPKHPSKAPTTSGKRRKQRARSE
ncbi:AAA family ATPase [Pantanalinema sp. GBBB05]|uniref:AAA family ATPase n=1 Tax=Pantanalinema sp. GBBB05 TaxID=2604139 RepID=UPI001E04D9CC|nr:AAA family ATPase [Pantanalinema sp. GBBB05]